MGTKSLGNPYDKDTSLMHTASCTCETCQNGRVPMDEKQSRIMFEKAAENAELKAAKAGLTANTMQQPQNHQKDEFETSEDMLDRAVENAIVRGMFGHDDASRRRFLQVVGGGTLAAALGSILPMDKVKAAVKESTGKLEKTKLKVGFVPITCATPIIMAHPMGFYSKYGLDVEVIKTAGWAVARDKSLNGEYDASHMLTPMPLAMTLGAGSTAEPYIMPAVENINGQAIVLHNKHKDKRDPKKWKGFKFGVPFDYSMHN
ncbi:MAG: CmpA/NrtA family ABC transporter substrate-binding protein, partial [Ketobacteraceae bacterium]|nr:CmpA/NrtA family ABC transporter substrate-binding protein [Ketobacteraceae bacterium]